MGDRDDFLCKVCGEGITFASGGVACRGCSTLHHRTCWEYVGRCSVYACGESRFVVGDVDTLTGSSSALTAQTESALAPVATRAGLPARRPSLEELLKAAVLRGTLYCPDCHAVNPVSAPSCAFCDFPIAKAALLDPTLPPRRSSPIVPVSILMVRSLDRIAAGLVAMGGLLFIWRGAADVSAMASSAFYATAAESRLAFGHAAFGVALMFVSILLHLVGSFYEMGHGWARRLQLPISLAFALAYPLGTIVGLFMLLFWMAPSATSFFRRESQALPVLMP